MTDKIKEAAEKYAFRVPYDGSNNFYNEDRYKGFMDGATSEAAREYWDGQGWVRVEDGLPPEEDKFYYWLYSASIDNYEQGEYDYERKCFQDKYSDRLMYVTHWKTPAPPNQ